MIGATNAGYTVTVAAKVAPDLIVVLAEARPHGKFVVWTYNEATLGYFNGNYTGSFDEAWESFLGRVGYRLGLGMIPE